MQQSGKWAQKVRMLGLTYAVKGKFSLARIGQCEDNRSMTTCIVCDSIFESASRYRRYCVDCLPAVQNVQREAKQAMSIQADIRALRCVDCQRPASEYDHRYYARPNDVVPVCKSCNKARGPALDVRELVRKARGLDGAVPTFTARPVKPRITPKTRIELTAILDNAEKAYINKAIESARGNHTEAARILGVTYRSLRYRIERLQIVS